MRGEGVKHFTKTICKSIDELEIPSIHIQSIELVELKKIKAISDVFLKIQNSVDLLLNKQVNGFMVAIEDEFSNIFSLKKGTSRFTEAAIYHSVPLNGVKSFPVYGGEASHKIAKSFVQENATNIEGKPVTFFEGECLILSMDGSAGFMTFKSKGKKFTLNHHAACVKIKKKYENDINLKWFKYAYQNTLMDLSVSKGSSKTLSKTVLDTQIITTPIRSTQDVWVESIEELELISENLEKIGTIIERLSEKELVTA